MPNRLLTTLGAAICFVITGAVANAALLTSPVTLGDGGEVCEGPASLLPSQCDHLDTFADGPQTPPGVTIDLTFSGSGEAWIYGGVRGKNSTQFLDVFTLDGTGLYKLTLTALDFIADGGSSDFDATWSMGGTEVGDIGSGSLPTMLMTTLDLTGPTVFSLDASGGIANNSYMEYKLTIAAVPLPAGVILLLTGMGGLVAARRFRKA